MAPLSPKLVAQQVGDTVMEGAWARVTPGKPLAGDKAALVMIAPELVDPGYADFADHCYRGWIWQLLHVEKAGKPNVVKKNRSKKKRSICPSPGKAVLWVNAPEPGVFAAECDVAPLAASFDPDHWKLRTGDGTLTTVSKLPLPNRLVFTLVAAEAGWTQVIFRGTHDRWRLFGCSVHRL